jgi:predicted dehydrogenase
LHWRALLWEGFLEVIRYVNLFRSKRDGTWIITRDEDDRSFAPFRPNPLRHIESGTVRQLAIHHIDIKRFLFDGFESIGNRLAGLDFILLSPSAGPCLLPFRGYVSAHSLAQ